MECNKPKDVIEVNDTVNTQSDCGSRVRGDTGRRDRDCGCRDSVLGDSGIDSSLLFFFLLLVAIVCKSDCDIELDTLLFFFLLLVVLFD